MNNINRKNIINYNQKTHKVRLAQNANEKYFFYYNTKNTIFRVYAVL